MTDERILTLPNSVSIVQTSAGPILVNAPPETLKALLAQGLTPPQIILLPPDAPRGQQLDSTGFVRHGSNYASVEFLIYANYFGGQQRTRIITVTDAQARRLRTILEEAVSGPLDASAYGQDDWLQRECAAISLYPPLGRAPRIDDMTDITSLEAGGGNLESLRISLVEETFVFAEDEFDILTVSTQIAGAPMPLVLAPPQTLLHQELTVQFIGGSDGFDPSGITTCFLAYLADASRRQAILFDTAAYLRVRLGNLGVSPGQISVVLLSHLHEDHLSGLPELILTGTRRVQLITSDLIYASLLRMMSAMLAVPEAEVTNLFDFVPLNPGRPLDFQGQHWEAIYAVHSIPTLAVRVQRLCYSGDMRYDERWFAELETQGILSRMRKAELVQFGAGADIVVQDVGGGAIHSTLTPELIQALGAKYQRIVLAHTGNHPGMPEQLEFIDRVELARSGHIVAAGELVLAPDDHTEIVETLSLCPLFARLTVGERVSLAHNVLLTEWQDGSVILSEGEPSTRDTFVVHRGLVDVRVAERVLFVAGRGNSIGERGALRGDLRTGTVVAHGTAQLLRLPYEVFRSVADRLDLVSAFTRADRLWRDPAFRLLPWANLLDLSLDFQPNEFSTGQHLFRAGEFGEEGFLLISGSIVVDGNDQQEHTAKPGAFLGGYAALHGTFHKSSAYAAAPSEVWALPTIALERLAMIYPNVLLHLGVTGDPM